MPFEQLGLTPELLRAVSAQGYTVPTPVQAESIPHVLAGRDLLAGAQTGTGKTAAFVLPILQILNASRPEPRRLPAGQTRGRGSTGLPIRCLVLTPTRELALQVEESVRIYGAERPIRSTTIYGGVGFDPQVRALRAGPEIVVATPGRLLDHAGQGTIDLRSVEILVLDEADRMLDMGFIRDIRRILALIPARRQNLLFSATFSDEMRELSGEFLRDPAQVQIARRNAPIELVRQVVYPVDRERKRELLSHLIRGGRIDKALVFTRTKHAANRLADQLILDGIAAAAIHGNKSQGQRVRALDDFKSGRVAILVATEVAARGLDIEALPHVVNFELPMVANDYVHRIGRTGRAGMEGDAVSLVCVDEMSLLKEIETVLRGPIPRETIAGFEVDRSIRPEAIRQRSMGGRSMGARTSGRPMSGRPMAARPAAAPMAPRPAQARPFGAQPMTRPMASRPASPAEPRRSYAPGQRQAPQAPAYSQADGRDGRRPDNRRPTPAGRPGAGSRNSARTASGRATGTGIGAGFNTWIPAPRRGAARPEAARNGYPAAMPGERIARTGRRTW
jgi:ATP-dependent RNA helicase RhlE